MEASHEQASTDAVREHYDSLSLYYRALWGQHIHHGLWTEGDTPASAQRRLVEYLAERAKIRPASRVLDIGCGLGGSSLWLAGQLRCEVRGITISPVQADAARQRAADAGLASQVRFEVVDANDLRLPEQQFDAVWVIECSEHLEDKAKFFRQCAGLLRSGGKLALCAWLAGPRPLDDRQRQLLGDVCSGMLCPSVGRREEHLRWIRDAGFDEVVAEDLTDRVRKTWDHCVAIVQNPPVRAMLKLTSPRIRRFVATFPAMQQAYATGAMRYGLFTARKH